MLAWFRKLLNLDGPWYCPSCDSWTIIKATHRCTSCNRRGCSCAGGIGEDPIDRYCPHHGNVIAEVTPIRKNTQKDLTPSE